jgi:hypothetical protein
MLLISKVSFLQYGSVGRRLFYYVIWDWVHLGRISNNWNIFFNHLKQFFYSWGIYWSSNHSQLLFTESYLIFFCTIKYHSILLLKRNLTYDYCKYYQHLFKSLYSILFSFFFTYIIIMIHNSKILWAMMTWPWQLM